MIKNLRVTLLSLLACVFCGVSVFGSINDLTAADQQTDQSASPILKKEQKNQRRMEKNSRKSKPRTSRLAMYTTLIPS